MNKKICIIASFLCLLACNTNNTPKYFNPETDLEAKNLYGQVAELKEYQINIKDADFAQTEKPIIQLHEIFTDLGGLKQSTTYDAFGKKESYIENDYDDAGLLKRYFASSKTFASEVEFFVERDTTNNIATTRHFINDTLQDIIITHFREDDRILKEVKIKPETGDTSLTDYQYEFDDNGSLIRQLELGEEFNVIEKYKYHLDNNLAESHHEFSELTQRAVYEYTEAGRLQKATHFEKIGNRETLSKIISYDAYFNPIKEALYIDGQLDRILKYDYNFDNKGNWVQKRVYIGKLIHLTPSHIIEREIRYKD